MSLGADENVMKSLRKIHSSFRIKNRGETYTPQYYGIAGG
jgi:hypothetical protein